MIETADYSADTVKIVMPPGKLRRPRAACLALAATAALCCALAPTIAGAVPASPGQGDLSSRLAELAKPGVRSAPAARQAEALGLARKGPGSLLRDGNRVLVEVRFDRGAAAGVEELRAAGAKVVNVSPRYQTVTVAAKPAELHSLSRVSRVAAATEVLAPFTSESACPSGGVVSEGDLQLKADEARETALDGSGVIVGVLSDSFGQATEAADGSGPVATTKSEDVANGDLPGFANTCAGQQTPVEILSDTEGAGDDEGRAMAQIVHDLAPGADLAFATAFAGETAFAESIEELTKSPAEGGAGASVVVDDVAYFEEPFFQEGPVAVAVRRASEDGASYFSSAANNNVFDSLGREIGSWEAAAYRDSGGCPPAVAALPGFQGDACMDFHPGAPTDRTLGIKVAAGGTLLVDLQWNEPWGGVGTDLDAFLLDSEGEPLTFVGEDNIGLSQTPTEILGWENETASQRTVQLVINRFSGVSPRLKLALLENGSGDVVDIEYPRSTGTDVVGPTIFGHNGAAEAITVAAVPFDNDSIVEEYSSRGPVTHYFGPVEGPEPAEALGSPEVLSKPDVAATDCGRTTFFAFFTGSAWRFCGTSAAAPHAAAVAALMLEADETASPAEIRAALRSSAVAIPAFDECAAGAGLVEAVGAIEDLLAPPFPTEPECDAPEPEASVEEAQKPGNWGVESTQAEEPGPGNPTEPAGPAPTPASPTGAAPDTSARLAPGTFFRRRPAKVLRTPAGSAKALFEFSSDESAVVFLCKVDREPFRRCGRRIVRRFRLGRHVLRVKARDQAGNTDPTPAVYRFRVQRVG
jgi:hypothetical protein